MEGITVESDTMSEMVLCSSQPDPDGRGLDKTKEDIVAPHTDEESSTEQCGLENRSASAVDIITQADDGSYYITWTVSITLAVPREKETDDPETPEKSNKISKEASFVMKTLKARSFYHIEYKLLPGDTETVKVDLVVVGLVARMYKGDKVKILRTWHEGDQIWIGLIQDVKVQVNREMLISLLSHKIKLQIWNKREKQFSQARHDRLKALKLSQNSLENTADMCVEKSTFNNSTIEIIHKDGSVSAEVSLVRLLVGETSLTEHLPVCSAGVSEVICDISLDKPLISEELKADLNPLVITIISAHSMPSSPVPFHLLQEKCVPVYCQYKLPNLSMHKTSQREHSTNICFRDVGVILTGLMSPKELIDFLSGPPLEIEVHDRDRKLDEPSKPLVMSGTGLDDEAMINATHSEQRTTHMNSFGIASLNLCELLQGTTSLKVHLPIKCCPPTPLKLSARSRSTPDTAAHSKPTPQGHYLAANSTLKVKVELACPLSVNNENGESDAFYSPFGRIIYIFDYNNFPVMTKLRSEILRINAAAFHLGSRSQENIENTLSNYITNFKLDQSQDLDFVTGFHVLNKRTHIFVLEGLKHKAVRRLWEAVPMKLSGSAEEQVIVLYSSNMGFFKRIYDSLDLSLSPIHLCEPLDTITRQPVLYIRGTVPLPCLQALTRLRQLCQTRQLIDVVQCDLFPSADMILSMIEKFGLHDEQWKQKANIRTEVDSPSLPVQMKRWAPLNMHNREYMKWRLSGQQKQVKDFIQENIKKVHEQCERLQKPKAAVLRMDQSEDRPVHNYSIQTLNTKAQTMELIRRQKAKFPGRRFTYSQQYHSATMEPGDVASNPDPSSTLTAAVWISSMSSDRSKVRPRHPDEARVEELRKPWRENILHANILKPTLSRDIWAWSQHSEDFQLYSKPPSLFSPSPTSIYLAGDRLQQEQLEAARAQYSRWLKKLLPNSSTKPPGSSPPQQFKCHMGGNLTKLQDILKDEPKKYSLRKNGMILKPFPQLSVINLEDDREEGEKSVALAFAPGPCADRSLSSRNNAIPRHPSQHDKSHHGGSSEQPSFLYKRTALPLTDEERSFFSLQGGVPDMKARTTDVQPSRNIVEVRTHKNWMLYTK